MRRQQNNFPMEGRGGGKREEERRGGGGGNHRHLHEKSFPEEGGRARTWLFPPPLFESWGDGFKWTKRDRIEWGGGRRTLLGFWVAEVGEIAAKCESSFSRINSTFALACVKCFSAENWQFCRCLPHPGINPFEQASVMSPDGIIPSL